MILFVLHAFCSGPLSQYFVESPDDLVCQLCTSGEWVFKSGWKVSDNQYLQV